MVPLTNEEKEIYRKQNVFIHEKKNLVLMIKNINGLEIIVITLENIEELLMIFAI